LPGVATDLLFVYGTLRPGARSPMARYLTANADLIGRARYQGRLYRVAHYPGVVPSRHPQEWVIGDVLRLADPERVLRRLDIHEGCGPGAPDHPSMSGTSSRSGSKPAATSTPGPIYITGRWRDSRASAPETF